MSRTSVKKRKKFSMLRIFIVAAYLFFVGSLASHYISNVILITQKQQELNSIEARTVSQDEINDELSRILSGDEQDIIERVARDKYGYAMPNERVFIDMSGK
jgi:cell division protein FtsB